MSGGDRPARVAACCTVRFPADPRPRRSWADGCWHGTRVPTHRVRRRLGSAGWPRDDPPRPGAGSPGSAARRRRVRRARAPAFVEQQFRAFLGCGVLARGFARVRCGACAFERLRPLGNRTPAEYTALRPSPLPPVCPARLPAHRSSVTSGHGRSEGAFCPHLWNVDLRLTLTHPLSDEVAKLGAKRVAHGPYLVLQMAEVGVA